MALSLTAGSPYVVLDPIVHVNHAELRGRVPNDHLGNTRVDHQSLAHHPEEIKRKRQSIVNVALELRKRWEKRIEYLESRNEKIKAARSASYDREATEKLKEQLRETAEN